jgi:hypothetical protein
MASAHEPGGRLEEAAGRQRRGVPVSAGASRARERRRAAREPARRSEGSRLAGHCFGTSPSGERLVVACLVGRLGCGHGGGGGGGGRPSRTPGDGSRLQLVLGAG